MDDHRASSPVTTDLLLLSTAAIWGFAFVAQRVGMESVGPFLFNGIRFSLGALTLLPLILFRKRPKERAPAAGGLPSLTFYLWAGAIAGGVLFLASSLQQIGLVYTTAGKAGFITGLYVVLVPLLGMVVGSKPGPVRWVGALLAVVGLYFLSVRSSLTVDPGDLWVVGSAFFFAIHVLALSYLSPKADSLTLALSQYVVCAAASLVVGIAFEENTVAGVLDAAVAIVYGGCFSVGVAYTLQIFAQRNAHPAHAAIILSLEGVFAAIGGWLLIGETLSPRALLGCGFMLVGMITSQLAAVRSFRRSAGTAE